MHTLSRRLCAAEGVSVALKHKYCTQETTFDDKFKFPARLGTGENSVWLVS